MNDTYMTETIATAIHFLTMAQAQLILRPTDTPANRTVRLLNAIQDATDALSKINQFLSLAESERVGDH